MKIILSRKGFDSVAGGMPSPILPDNSLLSLPIPTDISFYTYNYLNWKGKSLGSIIQDLSKGLFSTDKFAHVDPDLNSEMLPRDQRAVAQIHFLEPLLTTLGWSGHDLGMTIQKLAAQGK